jgi:hypothetical protein
VAIVGSGGVTPGVVVVQVTTPLAGLVTVQAIDPPGLVALTPVTIAVRVVVPPSVGELDALIVTVGTKFEIPKVTELELPAR